MEPTTEPEAAVTRSPTIAKLVSALSKVQGEMKAAKKDSENPFFKSHYADLASIWDACRAPLAKNELAVLQYVDAGDLVTMLAHSSGEFVNGRIAITTKKDGDVQSLGSAITYLRRYALAAMVGVVTEDDDGNAATKPAAQGQGKRNDSPTQPQPAKPQPSGDSPKCPGCGTGGKPQAYQKPGNTHYCPSCGLSFEPGKVA
jgi:hypothetical protein